jgi:tetratricopeptide (TPR) repeat protein
MESMYADDAMRAMFAANKRLCKLFPKPLEVLESLWPYSECPIIHFRHPINSERVEIVTAQIRSLLYGMVGDCYRLDKQYEAAANCYQHASSYYMGGGYPAYYARMVLKKSMRAHYQKAYECISFANKESRRVTWEQQMRLYIACFIKAPIWFHISVFQVCFFTGYYERELAKRISDEQQYVSVAPRILN